jgi:ribosomal protein S18 acetylase RimI-like enzyme
MNIKIEIAGPADASQLAALHYLSHTTAFAEFASPEWVAGRRLPEYQDRWRSLLAGPADGKRARTWKATEPEAGNDVIGMVRISEMSEEEAQLTSMHVHPGYQRRGIGSLLMDAAVDHMRELGFSTAILGVIQANKAARAMYERRGWKVDELRPNGIEGVPTSVYRISLKP